MGSAFPRSLLPLLGTDLDAACLDCVPRYGLARRPGFRTRLAHRVPMESATRARDPRGITTGLGLTVVHVGALAIFLPHVFSWSAVAVLFVLYYLTGALGITLGYHRILTHRSLKVPKALEYIFTTLGALALQGGPIEWISTHRAHHAHTDREGDPHSVEHGLRWAHMQWLYKRNDARLSLAGGGVLDIALPVPYQHTGVEFVIENAGAPADVAANGGVAPGAIQRTRNTVAIEVAGDGARALTGGEFTEYPAHDDGFGFVDLPLAAHRFAIGIETLHHVIAVAQAASRLAFLDPAAQTAVGLGGKILEE